jgi:hypothetical protein
MDIGPLLTPIRIILAVTYVAAAVVVYFDLFVWRVLP